MLAKDTTTSRETIVQLVPLGAADAPALAAHLLALSESDRAVRFGTTMSDAAIRSYAVQATAGPASATEALIGVVDASRRVLGSLHLFLDAERAEAGLSVDRAYRDLGIAVVLLWCAFDQARAAGESAITLWGVGEDVPVLALARRAGLSVIAPSGECLAKREPLPMRTGFTGFKHPSASERRSRTNADQQGLA